MKCSDLMRRNHQFKLVLNEGKRYVSKSMTVFIRTTQSGLRIGIRTPKSIGNAVKRNRARRIVREIFRRNKFRFSGGFEIVCIAKEYILRNNLERNNLEFMNILGKAGCLKDSKERADYSN